MTKHEGHPEYRELGAYTAPAAPVMGEEMKAGEHTALPWSFDGNCGGYISQGGDRIARAYAHKDAAFIVEAVNSHHAMIAENKACYQRIDELETALKRIARSAWTMNPADLSAIASAALDPFPAESGAHTA